LIYGRDRVEDNFPRAIAGNPILLERPKEWPEFIRADCISPETHESVLQISQTISAEAKKSGLAKVIADTWRNNVLNGFLRTKSDYLTRALLPFVSSMNEDAKSG